ncbi:hypothetical protein NONI108955_27725 [Nocardia ninae]|uniref:DUF2637 domain-containing protein n=1 Tax=Nocardia ninae NBRC 108245 TaxID=1210091 RepID=A0A511M9A3_9NOCA|nr:hypothetical protein [Nocardia ninae]GEM37222.1 hypothetical protein NN4_17410 [Nocardia ninae NBRC 108245]
MRDEQSTGSSEIAALAQRVETARGKLPLQHDTALFEVLSEGEIGAERELAEWVRAQRRKQRRRAVEEELAAEKRDRRTAAKIRRADEADERWHRRALAARRRVSSEDARLAQLYRRAEWSSRALIAVVVLGMVWAGVNVQHNLVPSGDMSDPLYWLSYGIEAMISIPIITIMVAATTAARWGRELARGKVIFFETALLGTTIALNAGPHLATGSWGRAAEYSIAPIMVGVVIWLHAWVSARYALLIDGAPVLDQDATVRHRVSERDSRVGLTVDAPDDRRWLLGGVDSYEATVAARVPGADADAGSTGADRHSEKSRIDHAEPTDNGHAVSPFSADSAERGTYTPAESSRPATNGHATRSVSADDQRAPASAPVAGHFGTNGHVTTNSHVTTNGHVAAPFSAINGHPLPVELRDPRTAPPVDNARPATNGSALHADSANSAPQDAAATSRTAAQPPFHTVASSNGHAIATNGHTVTNGHAVTDDGSASTNGRPVSGANGTTPPNDTAHTNDHAADGDHATRTNGPAPQGSGHAATNGHAVTNDHATTDGGRPTSTNGQPVNGTTRTTPSSGDTAHVNGRTVDRDRTPTNGQASHNGHAMPLFPIDDMPREPADSAPTTPAPGPIADASLGDEPEEPHPGDPIRKAAATIADTVAQAISGETVSRPTTSRRKSASTSISEAEIEQLVFEENPEPPRPSQRTEPASIVGRAPMADMEPELPDDEDEIDEDDEITALAHEIARRRMSNLSVEQLAEILRLADESWLTPGIANEVGVSRAAVARAVEAGIKVRRPFAISG